MPQLGSLQNPPKKSVSIHNQAYEVTSTKVQFFSKIRAIFEHHRCPTSFPHARNRHFPKEKRLPSQRRVASLSSSVILNHQGSRPNQTKSKQVVEGCMGIDVPFCCWLARAGFVLRKSPIVAEKPRRAEDLPSRTPKSVCQQAVAFQEIHDQNAKLPLSSFPLLCRSICDFSNSTALSSTISYARVGCLGLFALLLGCQLPGRDRGATGFVSPVQETGVWCGSTGPR
jgi:hypothetical protein